MGYVAVIIFVVLLIPLVYWAFSRRPGKGIEGQEPIGKPVIRSEPAAEEATPAASSIREDTSEAQRRTPAA